MQRFRHVEKRRRYVTTRELKCFDFRGSACQRSGPLVWLIWTNTMNTIQLKYSNRENSLALFSLHSAWTDWCRSYIVREPKGCHYMALTQFVSMPHFSQSIKQFRCKYWRYSFQQNHFLSTWQQICRKVKEDITWSHRATQLVKERARSRHALRCCLGGFVQKA